MKKLLGIFTFVIGFTFGSAAFAYDAECKLNNSKEITINVSNKIMVVDNKWKVFYESKSWSGWYQYKNRGYRYSVGIFNNGQFPIEIINKYNNKTSIGTCYLI